MPSPDVNPESAAAEPNAPSQTGTTESAAPRPVGDPNQTAAAAAPDTGMSTAGVLRTVMDLSRQQRFGNYQVVRLIGQGAMGNVFEVLNLSFEPPRTEALKVIRSRLRSVAEAVQRFKSEMAKMANLRHGNIVAVFHAGTHEGELFFTMSFEGGGDLGELIMRENRLEPRRAAALLRTVAEAVEEAHRHNIVHRDLKPSNVLLRADDTPLVTDFGLAVLMSAAPDAAPSGTGPEGTPCYMPPEQAEARHADIGPRSDVYSLGAILYECLTGRPPFRGRDVSETLRLVRNAPLDPPRLLNPNVPKDLEAIVLKSLERDPNERYASAGELARALGQFLDRGARRSMSRRQKLALWLGVPAVALLLFAAAQVYQQRAGKSQARAQVAQADDLREQGQPIQALEQYAVALERYDDLLRSNWVVFGRADLRAARAEIRLHRAVLFEGQRQYAEALSSLETAQRELEELRAARSGDPRYLNVLAEVYHNLGSHYSDNRFVHTEREKGLEYYEKAIRLREDVRETFPGNAGYDRDLARSYGYQGDALLELDQTDRARHAYAKAEEIRTRLAAAPGADAATLCLRARDFANRSSLHSWIGDDAAALAAARERVAYLRGDRLPARLPGEFRLSRMSALAAVAELELDRPDGPAPDVKDLLTSALAEVRAVGGSDDPSSPYASDLIQVHTAVAKYHFLKGERPAARSAADAAIKLFDNVPAEKRTADDYYRRAQGYALLAKLSTEPDKRITHLDLAQRLLSRAMKLGFRHYYRVDRDRAFDDLRAAEGGDWYRSNVVEVIRKSRPGLRVG